MYEKVMRLVAQYDRENGDEPIETEIDDGSGTIADLVEGDKRKWGAGGRMRKGKIPKACGNKGFKS